MNLIKTFKNQGGIKLLKQYWHSGALFTAIGEFFLLGSSRTSLEILRLSTQLKTKQKLERNYSAYLTEFDKSYDETSEHVSNNKIWFCWFQGIENAPAIVKKCYQSIKKNLSNKEIILITKSNMEDYVEFPDYIQCKIDKGIISNAHLSDLLRLELLVRYGGTWIDATVLCTNNEIPSYMVDSDLFLFQTLKPGKDGHTEQISNWFITAKSNNKILEATLYLLYIFWKENDSAYDYFIFHIFFQIVIEKYPEEWNQVVPFSNSTPHILLLRLYEKYDERTWDAILQQSPFHKLTYKTEKNDDKSLEGTYLEKILQLTFD